MKEQKSQKIQHIFVIEDEHGKRTVSIDDATSSIGRDIGNSIVLHSKSVSRQHAILMRVTTPDTDSHLFRLIDGNLQGKRSTNGLLINSQHCYSHDLKHGDEIIFGKDARARYYATSNISDIEFLTSCESEDVSAFLPSMSNPFATLHSEPYIELQSNNEAALVRLASFPELFSSPIIEMNLSGSITYLNPAATTQFPDIRARGLRHPILEGLLLAVQTGPNKFFAREIKIIDLVFEQSVHYIAESDLIRSYIVDITERKQTEAALKQAHDQLETRVQERTTELRQSNEKLRSQIFERERAEVALRSSNATNRALLNAIPDWLFRINSKGFFVNYKAAKDSPLPLPKAEFLEKSLSEIFPEDVAHPFIICVTGVFLTQETQVFEYQLFQHNRLLDYEARIAVTEGHEVLAIIRDITERKKAESDILSALAKEKQLSDLKSRFVSMTSHEFRTPLATILSSSELLGHYSHRWTEEKKGSHLLKIQQEAQHMTGMLDDVLLINKAEAGKLECNPAPMNLIAFCQAIVKEMQILSEQNQIILKVQEQSEYVEMDQKILRHIFSNLLSNAIKYSPQGGNIYFDLTIESEEAIFCVKDEGIGIPKSDQPQIFNSFERASNIGNISGTGLGLAIVKRGVDLHRGSITVESDVGIGTSFTVKFPFNQKG